LDAVPDKDSSSHDTTQKNVSKFLFSLFHFFRASRNWNLMSITKSSFFGWPGNLLQPQISGDNLRPAQAVNFRVCDTSCGNFFCSIRLGSCVEVLDAFFFARVSLADSVMVPKCSRLHLNLSSISPRKRPIPVAGGLPHADRRCWTGHAAPMRRHLEPTSV
jgi:hypothetical protein